MDSNNAAAGAVAAGLAAYGLVLGLIGLAVAVLAIVAYWRIVAKAGYSGALSLLMLIPVVNFVLLLVFAFGEWPIESQLRALRSANSPGSPGWQPPAPTTAI